MIEIILLLIGLLSANVNTPVTSETWTQAGTSVCAWFDETRTDDFMGINDEPLKIYVNGTEENKGRFSFIRLPMKAAWFGNEIDTARLYLDVVEGETPSALRVGLIHSHWSGGVTTLADAQKVFDRSGIEEIPVREEPNGWISLDITNHVIGWLNGDAPNYGLVLFGADEQTETAFASDWNGENENYPSLEVTGTVGNRALTYGKFGYLRHPQNESGDTANCLSYALRDNDMITAEDLLLNYEEMTAIYKKYGEDSVADYCAGMIADYADNNKEGLKISGFRKIDDFDSEIDPAKEYRIALRVGCDLYDETDVLDDVSGNFDFHLWAQINNGQWAQKFISDPTEIVPCTPPGVSPAKYPWDAQLEWGYDKFDGFYTSKAVYFAVTKDANGFTNHKT